MSDATSAAPARVKRGARDQRIFLHEVSWPDFERILAIRGDRSVPRMTYLEGELELMSPSRGHEWTKTTLARLLETWAEERGIELEGIGSWTLKSRRQRRAAEPDECYEVGQTPKDRPDVAIEVIWTHGGLDKLEVYRGLRVREVWLWQAGAIQVHALRGLHYERIERSEVLPDVDLELLVSCLQEPTQTKAVRRLRAALRGR